MIYHLAYDGSLTYTDDLWLSSPLMNRLQETDLERLTWKPSRLVMDPEYQQLALRHAYPGVKGIYFPAENFSARIQLDQLLQDHAITVAHRPEHFESETNPGSPSERSRWLAQCLEENKALDRIVRRQVKKLRQDIASILAEPVPEEIREACLAHGLCTY